MKLQHFPTRRCLTAAGVLIHNQKVLLIKHKKLGFWLVPGGHVEEHELPHQAAEREFIEETGITVKAINFGPDIKSNESEYIPNPFATNLHWISETNFNQRTASDDPTKPMSTETWPRGCEQHYTFIYLMEPVSSLQIKQNIEETDGIDWFGSDAFDQLETTPDIRSELNFAIHYTSNK